MPERQVEICGGSVPAINVSQSESLQRILNRVAKACNVQPAFVKVSVGGRRAKDLSQVPAPDQVVTAAVRSSADQEHVVLDEKEVGIPPIPVIMKQEMEGLNVVVAFDEVIDNSIRAGAKRVAFALQTDGGGRVTGLECQDDGAGMAYESAINHMRLAHTDSGIVTAPREYSRPLAAGLYFNKNLSRHGKGAAALLYFGDQVKTSTKTQDASETVVVAFNYQDWMKEFAAHNTCTFKVRVTRLYDFTVADESYTHLTIEDLRDRINADLADPAKQQEWAREVASHYYFFVNGFPERLWQTLPETLHPTDELLARIDAAEVVRPAGGVNIDVFGIKLSREQGLPRQVQPGLGLLLDSFMELMGEFGQQNGQPKLMPFWLPIRWTERGMAVEQVPDASMVKVGCEGSGGPAGMLRGVHRDFLLLLLYYPYKDGKRTKPRMIGDAGVEDVLHTAWCGRVIPKACQPILPPLVAEARESREDSACAWMLTDTRLCGVLFCSPEVYTSNHKTELLDDAVSAVFKRLGARQGRGDSNDQLWCWDTRRNQWCASPAASKLLLEHHKLHWAPLEQQGELLETFVNSAGIVCGKSFKPPGNSAVIKAGDLVQVLVREDRPDDSTEAGSSKGRRGGGTASGKATNSSEPQWPMGYRIVEHFEQTRGDGARYEVAVREWTPDWVARPGQTTRMAPSLITAVSAGKAQKLVQSWSQSAPRHLAWWDPIAKKPCERVEQLPSITSLPVLTVSQVPESLAICFVNSGKKLGPEFKRELQWSSSVSLDKLAVRWQLFYGTIKPGGRIAYNKACVSEQSVKYTQANKCVVGQANPLRWLVNNKPGHYCLRVKSSCDWVDGQLEYMFHVGGHEACTLEASWSADSTISGPVPLVRLTEELPLLELRAQDNNGKVVPLPFISDEEVKAALKVSVKSADGSSMLLVQQATVCYLAEDKQMFTVKNLRLAAQKLRDEGNASKHAYLCLELALPDSNEPLMLAGQGAPAVQILSGPPAKLEATYDDFCQPKNNPYTTTEVSRGSALLAIKLLMLDSHGNKLDLLQNEEFCARVRFYPPLAVEPPSAVGRSTDPQAGPSSRRRKSGMAAAGDDAAAAAAIAVKGYEAHVDGNVIDLPPGFRWSAPPGAGPVGITIDVFSGMSLAQAANAEPLLTQTGWYRMQRMHVAVEHDALDFIGQHSHRLAVWRGKESFTWSQGMAFVLNTVDFETAIEDQERHVPLTQDAAVPEEVMRRFLEGYEPRQDVLEGRPVNNFITPSGKKLCSQSLSDHTLVKGKVPFFLARAWNSLLNQTFVYEVVFMITPNVQQTLEGMTLLLCNEADRQDMDFRGRAKLCLLEADQSYTPLFSTTTSLTIAGGQLQLPPVKVDPEWLTQESRGTATLVLLDDEPFAAHDPAAAGPSSAQQWQWSSQPQKELGRIHLRLAPAAERLLVMAAGPLFKGMCMELRQPQQTAGRGSKSQQATGTVRLLEQQVSASSGAAGSSRQGVAAAQGAWSAWKCVPAQGRGESAARFVDPRSASLQGRLRLQLGQPITLHFVAVDYMGCPAVLSRHQRQKLWRSGLQLQPASATDAAMMVNVDNWSWGTAKQVSATATAADCSGHLGGPFVNSCTFAVSRGCGEATLTLRLEGSFGRETLLDVPVLLEAGPVAADGLHLLTAQVQRHGTVGATSYTCSHGGLISMSSWQPLQTPLEAEVRVKQEPGVEEVAQPQQQGRGQRQSRRQQQPDVQQVQRGDDADDPIDLCSSDDGDDDNDDDAGTADMEVEVPAAPQHFAARQQWLASLGVQQPAVLYTLQQQQPDGDPQGVQLVEGSSVRLQLQLFDSQGHEVAADKPGQLLLRHLQNWQEVQQQQQQQQQQALPRWQDLRTAPVSRGAAEVTLQLGVGDAWAGEQVFLVQPTGPQGSELAAALPVLLKVEVAPGPFPGDLLAVNLSSDLAAAGCSSFCWVAAAEALQELYGSFLQQQELQALLPPLLGLENITGQEEVTVHQSSSSSQGVPAVMQEMGVRVLARDGSTLAPESLRPLQVQLETWVAPGSGSGDTVGSWVPAQPYGLNSSGPVTVPPLPDSQGAQGEGGEDTAEQQQAQVPRFKLPLSCRQLPQAAGWYRLTVSYDTGLPSSYGPLQLQVGPVLLLSGTPYRLLRVPDPQQEAPGNRGRPLSGKRKRPAAAAGAGAGPSNQAAAAPPAEQFVVLDQLDQAQSMQQVLQLQDVWGNTCKPAAAKLAALLPASAQAAADAALEPSPAQSQQQQEEEAHLDSVWTPEQMSTLMQLMRGDLLGQPPVPSPSHPSNQPAKRQRTTRRGQQAGAAPDGAAAGGIGSGAQHEWQLQLFLEVPGAAGAATSSRAAAAAAGVQGSAVRLITTLPFNADGCCTVPALSLREQLGITSVGEYRLVCKAAPVSGEAGASSSSGGLLAGSQLVLLLGSWHVVSESTRELTQRQVAVKAAQRNLDHRVKAAKLGADKQEASLPVAQGRLRAASAAAKAAKNALQTGQGTLNRPPHVQLQQAAATAAQQQLLLAGNRGRQPLLEHPWMRHAGVQAQRQQLAARPCTANEVQAVVPNPMLQLHQAQPAVLGPIITLGSVELPAVAVLLSAYLGSRELQQLVCLSESVKGQVIQALGQQQDMYALDLGSLLRMFQAPTHEQLPADCAWYLQHPQQLLAPPRWARELLTGVLDWSRYNDDQGFIGFAVNLVHLNAGLLGLRFDIPAQLDNQGRLRYQRNGRMTMDLRRTLWHWKLGNVLVFETERHVEAFRRRLQAKNRTEESLRLIALEGYTFNVRPGSLNHRLHLDGVSSCLGAAGLDAAANPLDLRLRCIKERQAQLQEAREVYRQAQEKEREVQQELRDCEERLRRAKQDAAAAEADRQRGLAQHEQQLAEIAEQLRQRQQAGM